MSLLAPRKRLETRSQQGRRRTMTRRFNPLRYRTRLGVWQVDGASLG
jgi:hypothetical protein